MGLVSSSVTRHLRAGLMNVALRAGFSLGTGTRFTNTPFISHGRWLLRAFLLLYPYNCDLRESFFKRGGLEFGGHAAHNVFGDHPVAALVALNADFKRYLEENGLHFVAVVFGQLDPVLALLRGEIGGVDVIHRTLGNESGLEHRAQVG